MQKIYIKLYAGLGNQLFQYAYGKYLETQEKEIRYILNRIYNKNGLCYDLPECFLVDEKQIIQPKTKLTLVLQKIVAKYFAKNWNTGFYQEYQFVENLSKSLFVFKKEKEYSTTLIFEQIKNTNSVSVHIRGGDYLEQSAQSQYGNICTIDYYKTAIENIKSYIKNPTFFIFSNELPYAQKIIQKITEQTTIDFVIDFVFVQHNEFSSDPAYELFLMTQCKHNVIANSTYSWWGAFLNQNNTKRVIAPKKWNNCDNSISEKIVPLTWIKI